LIANTIGENNWCEIKAKVLPKDDELKPYALLYERV